MALYGYRYGERWLEKGYLDSTSDAVVANDGLALATAGYLKKAAANDTVVAFAVDAATAGSTDGAVSLMIDVSPLSVYEFPPDTGSVTAALRYTLLDWGGSQTINIDATTDKCMRCVDVDTINNTLHCSLVLPTA